MGVQQQGGHGPGAGAAHVALAAAPAFIATVVPTQLHSEQSCAVLPKPSSGAGRRRLAAASGWRSYFARAVCFHGLPSYYPAPPEPLQAALAGPGAALHLPAPPGGRRAAS